MYDVLLRTVEWAPSDIALFRKFGEPEVNVGVGEEVKFAKVMTEFPVRATFSEGSADEAEFIAEEWKDEIIARIKEAVLSMRQLSDGFSGEEVHMV